MSAVILLPVVILSVVALAILLKAERDSGQRGVRETARSIRLGVDRELALAETALKTLATSRRLKEADYDGFAQQARAARTNDSSWIILFDDAARQLVNTRFPDARGQVRANPGCSGRPRTRSPLPRPRCRRLTR